MEDHAHRDAAHEESMLNKVEIMLHLRSLDLFARLTTQQLSELARVVQEETYRTGNTILREGEFGDCLYLVVEGEVRVTREGHYVGGFRRGEFFGEMTVFDGETRSATATAATPVRLVRLQRHDLLKIMDEEPGIAIAICQTLSRHVRDLMKQLEGRSGGEKSNS
jgi:CRP-like cAMP-binding protein